MTLDNQETNNWGDWRIMGQEKYLKKVTLKWTKWRMLKPSWDHDHCSFCSQKFSDNPNHKDAVKSGYTTLDEYYWICKKCFNDFKPIIKWKVKEKKCLIK
jgi:hypothetical protein